MTKRNHDFPSRQRGGSEPYDREVASTETPWHETEEDIREKLEWGAEKAERLSWIELQMRRRLTKFERKCLRTYYFKNLTYEESAKKLGVSKSSVHRGVQRAIGKLRMDARPDYDRYVRRKYH